MTFRVQSGRMFINAEREEILNMYFYELIDYTDFEWLKENGYVREQTHPNEPLKVVTYSDKAQVEGEQFWRAHPSLWHLRGLIYNIDSGEIVARPFRKFWNHGQGAADKFHDEELVHVTDKVDGSLGIMYREPLGGEIALATRGSFTSDQALAGTAMLRLKYGVQLADRWTDPRILDHASDEETFLFEIVYPENRIVVDYHGAKQLFLLGSVDMETGHVFTPGEAAVHLDWYGPEAQTFEFKSFKEALEMPPRHNAEGIVVSNTGGSRMVKIKQEDYVALHKIVTGLSERRVWQALMAGQTPAQICEPLPDEFHVWVLDVGYGMIMTYEKRRDDLNEAFINTMDYAFQSGLCGISSYADESKWTVSREQRGAVAALFKEAGDDAWAMFALLDGRDISEKLWKQLEPKGDVRPNNTPKEV